MSRFLLMHILLAFANSQQFEGIDPTSILNDMIKLNPGNHSFTKIDQLLSNNSKYMETTAFGNFPLACSHSFLNLAQSYKILQPLNVSDSIFNSIDINFPFSSFLVKNISILNQNFCFIYNQKNLAIILDKIESIPCMNYSGYIHLLSVSLSLDSSLVLSNYPDSLTVFDSTRYHQVNKSNEFGIKFQFGIPFTNQSVLFYPKEDNNSFHYRFFGHIDMVTSKDMVNMFAFKMEKLRLDLFLNGENLLSLENLIDINGVLSDQKSEESQLCFPNGLFLNYFDQSISSIRIASRIFSNIIGSSYLDFEGNVDLGFYINMRNDTNNGFYFRGSTKISLFKVANINADIEFQKINAIEAHRRLKSLEQASNCSKFQLSSLTSKLMGKYFTQPISSNSSTDFYFFMGLKTKESIYLPFIKEQFTAKGILDAIFVSPSPIDPNSKYHGFLTSQGDILNHKNANVTWEITENYIKWNCVGTYADYELDLNLISYNSVNGSRGWLSSIKNVVKAKIKISPSTKIKLTTRLVGNIVSYSDKLSTMWNKVEKEINFLIDAAMFIYNGFNCYTQGDIISCANAINQLFDWLGASFSNLFISVFGKKKESTWVIGKNDFNCTLYRTQVKKCVWKKCKVVKDYQHADKPCMDKVKARMEEMINLNKLKETKEEILNTNKKSNLGIQYVLEEVKAGREFITADEIDFGEVYFEFPAILYKKSSLSEKFDQTNTSFIDEFETNIENIFEPFNNIEEDIDLSQVYINTQDLKINTTITFKTKRLSALFKGKDNLTVSVSAPARIDLRSPESLKSTLDSFYEKLIEEKGALFEAIIGDNHGISEDLIDAIGMSPPVVAIKNPFNPSIYCDDPEIDPFYGEDDEKLIKGLEKYLTPLTIDQINRKCKTDIKYYNEAVCLEHETICGATKCSFTRFVYDGCGQKSNEVIENVIVLPRKPYFESFPANFVLACDETKNITENETRFVQPSPNSGCKNVETSFYYDDTLYSENMCSELIYRKWTIDVIGCEKSLFSTRNQKLYVEDQIAPYFSFFPPDQTVDFFSFYGTDIMQKPRVQDSCGHGPSNIKYEDKVFNMNLGERIIRRIWQAEDSCGNKRNQVQQIKIKNNLIDDTNYSRNFLLFSYSSTNLSNSKIYGSLGSRMNVRLINSTIGNDLDSEAKCNTRLKWTIQSGEKILIDNSDIHGSIKTSSDFDFEKDLEEAILISKFLNDTIENINIGADEINCIDRDIDLSLEFPILNYLNSECETKKFKYFPINTLDENDINEKI